MNRFCAWHGTGLASPGGVASASSGEATFFEGEGSAGAGSCMGLKPMSWEIEMGSFDAAS